MLFLPPGEVMLDKTDLEVKTCSSKNRHNIPGFFIFPYEAMLKFKNMPQF